MNNTIETMLEKYKPTNKNERENAIKEIIQEIALAGLYRGGFFEKAAFYGGTCLRIFYGLNRFSEDLDFALLKNDPTFKLDYYFPSLKKEFESFGLDINIETKIKNNDTDVQSAFLKGNTLMLMMAFFPKNEDARKIVSNQKIKIKFEVDIDNPEGGHTINENKMIPAPYMVKIFDEPTLFAGKIHAIICRKYANNVKGRDYYDYLFYINKGSKINLIYLENKLKNSGKIDINASLTLEDVKKMLKEKFLNTDYETAKNDVKSFIQNKDYVNFWDRDVFISTLNKLETE